ncbi:MAG: polyprenyl diphosphate synthase [Candidatus Bilamarchaeaceae archaeon]
MTDLEHDDFEGKKGHDHGPKHIAIIPDGNRRWGELHGVGREKAYDAGIEKIKDVVRWCRDGGVTTLTMWGFSTDNFKRDSAEVEKLFGLFYSKLQGMFKDSEGKKEEDIRIRFLGRTHLFPERIRKMFAEAEKRSAGKTKYSLNLLLAYGGREELVDAVNELLASGVKKVDERELSRHLYTRGEIPDPDLVIRTSGEQRLSGLMPWQTTYSELYFSKKLWPDFNQDDFREALEWYGQRKRKFGK